MRRQERSISYVKRNPSYIPMDTRKRLMRHRYAMDQAGRMLYNIITMKRGVYEV